MHKPCTEETATLARKFGSEAEMGAAFELAFLAGAKSLKRPVFWVGYSGYFAEPDWEVR